MDKLEKYRKKIDDIDAGIVKLIAKRARQVERIGRYKKRHDIQIVQTDRWQKILDRVKRLARETEVLDEKFVEDIWNRMHEEFIEQEKNVKKR